MITQIDCKIKIEIERISFKMIKNEKKVKFRRHNRFSCPDQQLMILKSIQINNDNIEDGSREEELPAIEKVKLFRI